MKELKLIKKENHLLNYEVMDNLHMEFIDIYNSVDINSNESIKSKAMALLVHSKNHFMKEEKLMDSAKYPRGREHKNEHNKLIAELEFFIDKSVSVFGMNILKSFYLEKLPYWFHYHLLNMDSDLTGHLKTSKLTQHKKKLEVN